MRFDCSGSVGRRACLLSLMLFIIVGRSTLATAAEWRQPVLEVFVRGDTERSRESRAFIEKTYGDRAGLSIIYRDVTTNDKELARLLALRPAPTLADARRLATNDRVKSAGLDFGLAHEATFGDSKIVNRVSYVPSFDDFSDFRLTHESFYEMPLANPAWKLRLGVNNDYTSKPGKGVEKLDTGYFTRLVLNWK